MEASKNALKPVLMMLNVKCISCLQANLAISSKMWVVSQLTTNQEVLVHHTPGGVKQRKKLHNSWTIWINSSLKEPRQISKNRLQSKLIDKLLLKQPKLKKLAMDHTTNPHGTLNGEHTHTNGNQEVKGDLEADLELEVPQSTLENGDQAGIKDGSHHGLLVTGDGTSTSGQSMIRNVSLVAYVREAALLNTRLKKLLKSMVTQRRSLNLFTSQLLKNKRQLRVWKEPKQQRQMLKLPHTQLKKSLLSDRDRKCLQPLSKQRKISSKSRINAQVINQLSRLKLL